MSLIITTMTITVNDYNIISQSISSDLYSAIRGKSKAVQCAATVMHCKFNRQHKHNSLTP